MFLTQPPHAYIPYKCHLVYKMTSLSKMYIQSTLAISKSKGPSKTLRDIRTSTYQICSTEEKTIRTTKFHKCLCNLTPLVRNILKVLWKSGEIAPQEQFLLFSTIFCNLILDFCVQQGPHFLFDISGYSV